VTFDQALMLAGGLAFFLYGMRLSTEFLQKIAGRKLRAVVASLASNRLYAAATGAGMTLATNSSSAAGAVLVTLTNAQILTTPQAVAVFVGAAVGTSITIQILAFNLTSYSLLLVAAGFLLTLLRNPALKAAGGALLCFGFIFFGMHTIGQSVQPLFESPAMRNWLAAYADNIFVLMALGFTATALLQSSSASIGIVVALAFSGNLALSLDSVFGFVLGANVGTCIPSIIASIGASAEARRAAAGFTAAKLAAALIFIPFIGPFSNLVTETARAVSPDISLARLIGHAQLVFNLFFAAVVLAVLPLLVSALKRLIPEREPEPGAEIRPRYLGRSVVSNPSVALATVKKELHGMMDTALSMADKAVESIEKEDAAALIREQEKRVNALTSEVNRYLARVSQGPLDGRAAAELTACFNIANDIEAVGNVIHNELLPLASDVRENRLRFSDEGWAEIRSFHAEAVKGLRQASAALRMENRALAERLVSESGEFKKTETDLRMRHMARLGGEKPESVETSAFHLDILTDLSAIHAYAVSVAENVLHMTE
jgi:phosphate:Na+ symporter